MAPPHRSVSRVFAGDARTARAAARPVPGSASCDRASLQVVRVVCGALAALPGTRSHLVRWKTVSTRRERDWILGLDSPDDGVDVAHDCRGLSATVGCRGRHARGDRSRRSHGSRRAANHDVDYRPGDCTPGYSPKVTYRTKGRPLGTSERRS